MFNHFFNERWGSEPKNNARLIIIFICLTIPPHKMKEHPLFLLKLIYN